MNFKNVVYRAILIFLAAIFLVGGLEKLMAMEYWQARFVSQWGLPAWMAPMIGATEILGGLMLLVPRLTTLGAAIIVIVMFGATATQIVASEWLRIIVPLVVGTMAGILFKWSLLRVQGSGGADGAKNSH